VLWISGLIIDNKNNLEVLVIVFGTFLRLLKIENIKNNNNLSISCITLITIVFSKLIFSLKRLFFSLIK